MARKIKEVISTCGIDRRSTGYYSTPFEVVNYITERLIELNPKGISVLDPCVGKEELLSTFQKKGFLTTGIDIVDYESDKVCNFFKEDFLELYENSKTLEVNHIKSINFQKFDFFIANPPYNCHEVEYIKENKKKLKKVFEDVGVHNMYSMFISAILDLAKNGAIIGLITLDSFLTSKAHKELRTKLLNTCTIHDILLCPTDLFTEQGADVRTCVLIIEKNKKLEHTPINLLNRQLNKKEFFISLKEKKFDSLYLEDIILNYNIDNQEFLIGVPNDIKSLFVNPRVGELFHCVTGISTGNDKKYISKILTKGFSIPFYKNPGSKKFYTQPDGYLIDNFLEEDKKVQNFMVRNKALLFSPGITCSSMGVEFSACYLPENSTFGVNPNIICNEKDIWWLLAYLNSNLAKYIIRGVLIRTNMVTSGYIARLPLPKLSDKEKNSLTKISKEAYLVAKTSSKKINQYLEAIDNLIYENLNLSTDTIKQVDYFCLNIIKKT